MPAKALSSSTYTWRLAALCLLCVAFGAYFLYDGYVRYPFQQKVRAEFEDYERQGKVEQWNEYARQRGYPPVTAEGERPGATHSANDILMQKLIGYIILPIGLLFGAWFVRYRGRWIASDAEGLTTSWGQRVPFASVASLNKELWKKKGIAVVYYTDLGNPAGGGGGERRLILDDWKYDRPATTTMVQEIESRLPPEKVVGNPPSEAPQAADG